MSDIATFSYQMRRGATRQLAVVFAIVFKDFRLRLGKSRLGLVWVLLEPMAHMFMLSALWYIVGREKIAGVHVMLFMTTGIIPYIMFRMFLSGIPSAFRMNAALFDYPQVKPIDALLGRFIFEMSLILVAAALLYFLLGWTADITPPVPYPLECLGLYFMMMAMGLGLSLMIGTYAEFYESVQTAINVVTRPLIFISAVFYSFSDLPKAGREILAWNPLLQFIEHFRVYGLGLTPAPEISFFYISMFSVVSLGLGIITYYGNRFRILQRQ